MDRTVTHGAHRMNPNDSGDSLYIKRAALCLQTADCELSPAAALLYGGGLTYDTLLFSKTKPLIGVKLKH